MAKPPINLTFRDLQASKSGEQPTTPTIPTTPTTQNPVKGYGTKISVGARNIKITEEGSAAALGRQLQAAFSEIAGNLDWFCEQLEDFLPEDLAAALQPTFELSQVYVPKLTGDLAASGYVATEKFRGGARAEIGYGKGGQPDYAIYVHEMPFQHAEPTRDKFLQAAIEEDYYNILQRVTNNVKARVG